MVSAAKRPTVMDAVCETMPITANRRIAAASTGIADTPGRETFVRLIGGTVALDRGSVGDVRAARERAAVDAELRSGGEGRFIRCEVHDDPGDFLRAACPRDRLVAEAAGGDALRNH